jgi:hypothetical protein
LVKAHLVPLHAFHRPRLGFITPAAFVQVRNRIDTTGGAVITAHVVRSESFNVPVLDTIGIVNCHAVDRTLYGATDRELIVLLLATTIGRRRQMIRGGASGQFQPLLCDGGRCQVDQVANLQRKAPNGKTLVELAVVIRIAKDKRSIRALELVIVAASGFEKTFQNA